MANSVSVGADFTEIADCIAPGPKYAVRNSSASVMAALRTIHGILTLVLSAPHATPTVHMMLNR